MFENRWQCCSEQIRLNHYQIKRRVELVRRACQGLSWESQSTAAGLKAQLIQLQRVLERQLDQHQCGYIEDAVSFAPRFGRQAELLPETRVLLQRKTVVLQSSRVAHG